MNIIERLNNPEMYVDAVDDAIREIENLRLEKVALKAMLKYIEFEVISKCCPICGGNQCHDSACMLAAFLYPEKAESFKYHTHDTHTNEILFQVENDNNFAFLREELAVAQSAG
jgi:hypothetical protein